MVTVAVASTFSTLYLLIIISNGSGSVNLWHTLFIFISSNGSGSVNLIIMPQIIKEATATATAYSALVSQWVGSFVSWLVSYIFCLFAC